MVDRKRKAHQQACQCYAKYEEESVIKSEKEAKLEIHLAITSKIVGFSSTVEVVISPDINAFSVHKDLLIVHSGYFASYFHDDNDDGKLALPKFKPALFYEFISFMYTGKFVNTSKTAFGSMIELEELWELGSYLNAPSFQNMCMDEIRESCKSDDLWPKIQGVELMYRSGKKGSALRKFAAHSMACTNPFVTNAEGSKEYKDWERLVKRVSDISVDVMLAAGKWWNGTHPWDDEHRATYLEKEVPLEERWEKHILSARSMANIKKDAKANDIRSIIELEHLERNK